MLYPTHPVALSSPSLRFGKARQTSRDATIRPSGSGLPAPAAAPNRIASPARRAPTTPFAMSISLRLALPSACPVVPLPLRPRARNAGCSPTPLPAPAAASALRTGAIRGCASLPLKPHPLGAAATAVPPPRGSAAVCHASAYLSPPTMQWVSAAAAAVLFLAKGTGIHKSFLVPLFALQAPSSVISWIKSEYGLWTAFLALLVRLFFFVPGELELPLSTMLLVTVAPYQLMNLRGTQGGAILSLALSAFLAFQHFTRTGGIGKAFDQGSIIATLAIICITVINVIMLF